MSRRPPLMQLSFLFDAPGNDPRNRPPTALPTPDVMETLAELLLAAMTALRDEEIGDEPEDRR
jgi:hypothetical protein